MKPQSIFSAPSFQILTFGTAALVLGSLAHAADSTWSNTGTDFNTAGNWSAGVPGAGNQAIFNVAAVTNPNLSTSLSIGELTFSTATSSGYTLSASPGQSLTLTGRTLATSNAIESLNTSGTNTISANLIVSRTGGGASTFTQAVGGTLVLSGNISGTSTLINLARSGSGTATFTLSGNNSGFAGGFALVNASSALNIGSANALGSGTFVIGSGSSLTINNTIGSAATFSNNLNFSSTAAQTITFGGSDMNFSTGSVALGNTAATQTTLIVNSGTTVTLGGSVSQAAAGAGILKNGTGNLVLGGSSIAYTGVTTVSAGTLLINGNASNATGAVSVASAATLGGTGTVGGATTAASGSFLAPGTDGTAGTLTFASTLNISGLAGGLAGHLKFDLGAVGSSDIITLTTGALSIGTGLLNFDDFSFSTLSGFGGGSYTLFTSSTSITGTLGSNLTGTVGGLSAVLSLANSNQDLILTVTAIPEPSTYASLLGVVVLGSAALRRRRQAN